MSNSKSQKSFTIEICRGPRCADKNARLISERAENDVKFYDLKNIQICHTGCQGGCKEGPIVRVTEDKSGTSHTLEHMRAISIAEELKYIKQHGRCSAENGKKKQDSDEDKDKS